MYLVSLIIKYYIWDLLDQNINTLSTCALVNIHVLDLTCSCDAPVLTCRDPGNVAHSRKVIAGSRFTVGSTVQFICNKGYLLSGSSLLTCFNRNSATPKWSERLPKCVRKSQTYSPPTLATVWLLNIDLIFVLFRFCITLVFLCWQTDLRQILNYSFFTIWSLKAEYQNLTLLTSKQATIKP